MSAHGDFLRLSARQLDLLRALDAAGGQSTTLLMFASGTLSSCRKAGLVERVRVPYAHAKAGSVAGYKLTDAGRRALAEEGGSS